MCEKSSNFAAIFNKSPKKEVHMKRKIVLLAVVAMCSLFAQAGEYGYLLFTNTSDVTTALTVTNLSMTVNGNELAVTNDEGNVQFVLTELREMQFSKESVAQGIENVLDGEQPVQVYSIGGASLGTYDNLVQAAQQLSAGAYVIVQSNKSQKLVVK